MASMMKQSKNGGTISVNPVKRTYTLTDYVNAFTDGKGDMKLMTLEQKKSLLDEFHKMQSEITRSAGELLVANDPSKKGTKKKLDDFMPWTKSHRKDNNKKVAEQIINLSYPCKILLECVTEQENRAHAATPRTRSTGSGPPPKSDLVILLEKIKDIFEDVVIRAEKKQLRVMKVPDGPTLTKAQEARVFDITKVPPQEEYRTCLYCKHPSMNIPDENKNIVSNNKQVLETYNLALQIWEAFKKKHEKGENVPLPSHPKTGRPMRKKPTKLGEERAFLQCMCRMSRCMSPNDDVGSTCPIKCTDSLNGKRYTTNDQGTDCACPVCTCVCLKTVYLTDWKQTGLMLSLSQNSSGKIQKKQNVANENIIANTQCSKIGATFASSLEKTMKDVQEVNRAWLASQQNISGNVMNDMCYETDRFSETYAQNLSSAGVAGIGIQERKKINRDLCSGAGTSVNLHSGDIYDTRVIGMNPDQHARNNHLNYNHTGATNNGANCNFYPGMKSLLKPDNNLPFSDEFKDAAANRHDNTLDDIDEVELLKVCGVETTTNLVSSLSATDSGVNKRKHVPTLSPEASLELKWKQMKKDNAKNMFLHLDDRELNEEQTRKKAEAQKIASHMKNTEKEGEVVSSLESIGIDESIDTSTSLKYYRRGCMTP